MSWERFEQLAEAYGGDVARWPVAEREAAALLMAAEPDHARKLLEQADRLDAALDALTLSVASHALTEAILAAAPAPRRRGWRGWLLPAGLSAGLAAACAAGVVAGVQLSQTGLNGDAGLAAGAVTTSVADLDVSGLQEDV